MIHITFLADSITESAEMSRPKYKALKAADIKSTAHTWNDVRGCWVAMLALRDGRVFRTAFRCDGLTDADDPIPDGLLADAFRTRGGGGWIDITPPKKPKGKCPCPICVRKREGGK